MAWSDVEGVVDARGWMGVGVCTEPVWICEARGGVSGRICAVDRCWDYGLFVVRAVKPGHAVAVTLSPDTVCGLHLVVLPVRGARRGVEHVHGMVVFDVVPGGREGGGMGVYKFCTVGISGEFPVDGGVRVDDDCLDR